MVFVGCAERLMGQQDIFLPDRVADFVAPHAARHRCFVIISALYFLTRPVVDRRLSRFPTTPRNDGLAEYRARDIVRRHGLAARLDYFALRDDKQFYFFRDTLVAYAVFGGVALISPDPIVPTPSASRGLQRVS